MDFEPDDEIIDNIAKHLMSLNQPGKLPSKRRARDIMDYIISLFEGCKQYGDLEFEVWKQYYSANSLIEEREQVANTLRQMRRMAPLTPSQAQTEMGKKCTHLDQGRWVDDFVVFALKKSGSISLISRSAIDSIAAALEQASPRNSMNRPSVLGPL
jgi:hypothetical protein